MTFPRINPFTLEKEDPIMGVIPYIYSILYVIWFVLLVIAMSLVQLVCPNKRLYGKIVKWYTKAVNELFVPVRHEGYKGEPKEPTIVVLNHSCVVDFLLLKSIPFMAGEFISAGVFKRLWFIKRILKGYLNIVVEYGNAEKVIQDGIDYMKSDGHVIVFPEGDINTTDAPVLQFRKGAFELARRTGYKIQPVVIKNSRKFAPYKRGEVTVFNPYTLPLEFKWLEPYTVDRESDPLEEAMKLQRVYEAELS